MGDRNDDESEGDTGDLFREPVDYYPPDKSATFTQYTTKDGQTINLRLVGHSPLWGHLLWNAGRLVAQYLEDHADGLVRGRTVLELGAGAGLPSLICAANGAEKVIVTDYPDPDLIENLRYNIEHCDVLLSKDNIVAEGFTWGHDTVSIRSHLGGSNAGFDLLILADILFNHSEHQKLLSTVTQTLAKRPLARAMVFFTPYRPWLLEKDLHFFELAKAAGLRVKKLLEHRVDAAMFEDDPGDEVLRRTVFGFEVQW